MSSDDVGNNARRTEKKLGGITGKGFMPGVSGNPSGRPAKQPITDRYAVTADLPAPDYLLAALKLSEAEKPAIKTYGDALALSQFRAGIKGKTDAAREIADRLEGRARQSVEVSGNDGGPIVIDDLAAGRERVRIWRKRANARLPRTAPNEQ